MRSVCRLDGYRASPLVLISLRFCREGEVDAYTFPQEEEKSNFITWEFSEELEEEDYGEGDNSKTIISQESIPSLAISIISQESIPLLAISISEFEDEDDIHTITSQNDTLELED